MWRIDEAESKTVETSARASDLQLRKGQDEICYSALAGQLANENMSDADASVVLATAALARLQAPR